MTTRHANERVQFGKPIGRQQALQQNLAVMAEDAVAARIAAQLGCARGLDVSLAAAAVAKSTASSVAARLAGTAHAVHGAIGISEEFDLPLLTRRLHEWRLADGSKDTGTACWAMPGSPIRRVRWTGYARKSSPDSGRRNLLIRGCPPPAPPLRRRNRDPAPCAAGWPVRRGRPPGRPGNPARLQPGEDGGCDHASFLDIAFPMDVADPAALAERAAARDQLRRAVGDQLRQQQPQP
jgi:hypothetical protein